MAVEGGATQAACGSVPAGNRSDRDGGRIHPRRYTEPRIAPALRAAVLGPASIGDPLEALPAAARRGRLQTYVGCPAIGAGAAVGFLSHVRTCRKHAAEILCHWSHLWRIGSGGGDLRWHANRPRDAAAQEPGSAIPAAATSPRPARLAVLDDQHLEPAARPHVPRCEPARSAHDQGAEERRQEAPQLEAVQ